MRKLFENLIKKKHNTTGHSETQNILGNKAQNKWDGSHKMEENKKRL